MKQNYITKRAFGHPRATVTWHVGEHVLVAEAALGHYLPLNAEVHHVNGDRRNNRNDNLVICQDRTYHRLLHMRKTALRACGHADWRNCKFCKQYSPVSDLQMGLRRRNGYMPSPYHQACQTEYSRVMRVNKGITPCPQKGVMGNKNAFNHNHPSRS